MVSIVEPCSRAARRGHAATVLPLLDESHGLLGGAGVSHELILVKGLALGAREERLGSRVAVVVVVEPHRQTDRSRPAGRARQSSVEVCCRCAVLIGMMDENGYGLAMVNGCDHNVVSSGSELPPVGRSRWLRGRVGPGLMILLLPGAGGDVAEGEVSAA